MLVKPVTSEAHMTFCLSSSPMGCASSCRGFFQKYCYRLHFRRTIPSYHSGLTHMSPEEVRMREDLFSQYQRLKYEEGFGPTKYSLFSKRKWRQILALLLMHMIISRDIFFGEHGVCDTFFFLTCYPCLTNNMEQLNKALTLAKDQGLTINLSFQLNKAIALANEQFNKALVLVMK